jgi:hypothetical protein
MQRPMLIGYSWSMNNCCASDCPLRALCREWVGRGRPSETGSGERPKISGGDPRGTERYMMQEL